jgi:hypothetical protein
MTTDCENKETRPLEELLKLNTYQGMTDEEIEIVASFKYKDKALNEFTEELRKYNLKVASAREQAFTVMVNNSKEAYERIMNNNPTYKSADSRTVSFESYTPTTIDFNFNNDGEVSN